MMMHILKKCSKWLLYLQEWIWRDWFDGGYNSNKNIAFAHVEMVWCHISSWQGLKENVNIHRLKENQFLFSPDRKSTIYIEKLEMILNIRKDLSRNLRNFLIKKGIFSSTQCLSDTLSSSSIHSSLQPHVANKWCNYYNSSPISTGNTMIFSLTMLSHSCSPIISWFHTRKSKQVSQHPNPF